MGNSSSSKLEKYDPATQAWTNGLSRNPGRCICVRDHDLEAFHQAIRKDNVKILCRLLNTCRHRNSYQGQTLSGLMLTDRPFVKMLVATSVELSAEKAAEVNAPEEETEEAASATETAVTEETKENSCNIEDHENLSTEEPQYLDVEPKHGRKLSAINTLQYEGLNGVFTNDPSENETYDYTVEEADTFLHCACRHGAGKIVKWLLHWGADPELRVLVEDQDLTPLDVITDDSFREFYEEYLSNLNLSATAPSEDTTAKPAAEEEMTG